MTVVSRQSAVVSRESQSAVSVVSRQTGGGRWFCAIGLALAQRLHRPGRMLAGRRDPRSTSAPTPAPRARASTLAARSDVGDAVSAGARGGKREPELSSPSIPHGTSSTPSTKSARYEGKPSGSVSAFSINRETGTLTALNRQPSVGGGPAHLIVDHGGKNVLVANYGGGSVAVLPIGPDGALKPAIGLHPAHGVERQPRSPERAARAFGQRRQQRSLRLRGGSRPRQGDDLPARCRQGRADRQRSAIRGGAARRRPASPGDPSAGRLRLRHQRAAEQRHGVCARPRARRADSAADDLDAARGSEGRLPNYSTAEVLVHPSGKFLYGSNRGHDSIASSPSTRRRGRLTFVETVPTQGSTPRGFGIDPSGAYLRRRQSAVGFGGRLPDRSAVRTADTHRFEDRRRRPGQLQVRRGPVRAVITRRIGAVRTMERRPNRSSSLQRS